ncbi:MAG: N-acetylglucosamine-6-phosphate deacetylase [Atribacterota bacterium]|nr:N-acetylglucosamine-6-phosphate deacetylase [Atribacterota bacterium]MDD4895588.1 N-acetylglucosamine-6-phosphate deacetylase [Atribacterota bacterium]MDD5636839.1 N-acetylglucosamine-6-phosphate deacetylase [Atribacterota bacterium]
MLSNKEQRTVILNGTIFTPFQSFEGHIMIEKGKIISVTPIKDSTKDSSSFGQAEILEARNKYIMPGFIDLHVHGGDGADVMDGEYGAIKKIAANHCHYGTTAFLPTTLTMSKDDIIKSLQSIGEARLKGTGAAEILGIHLEGPYINPEKKGAQNKEDIIQLSKEEFLAFNQASGNLIRLVTLAPEMPGALDFIPWLCEQDIIASAGHTNATYEEMQDALQSGLNHVTHLFNAMRGLHHREPGIVGAALSDSRITVEVIADGIHIHPIILKIIHQMKGSNKIVLITDAIRATGLPEGTYDLGGQKVIVAKEQARLQDGTLAGSVLTMNKAVQNIVTKADIPLGEAIQMASYNPAKCLGINNKKGSLEPGKDADIVILNKNFEVDLTMVSGKVIFRREEL